MNPGIGSRVVTEFHIDRLVLKQEQGSKVCRLSPYALLEPLVLGNKPEFEAKVATFVHPVVLMGHGQDLKHVRFIPDEDNIFDPVVGNINLRLIVNYKTHNRLTQIFRKPQL